MRIRQSQAYQLRTRSLSWSLELLLLISSTPFQPRSNAFSTSTCRNPHRQLSDRTESSTTMSRSRVLRNPIAFVLGVVLVCSFVILALTMLRLPDPTTTATTHHSHSDNKLLIGKFGEMMIEMLPEDLAFTVFLPSEKAFKRDLRLDPSDSFVGEKMNDTNAVVSRVLGFSAVPRSIGSETVAFGKEISYDSISGFVLYITKDEDGRLVVNGVPSERVDLRRKGSLVHVMDGVLMDAEFQQSVQYDGEED